MTTPDDGTETRPLWVFGYGSLMWNPGFATPETRPARLQGWHRAFCIYSSIIAARRSNPASSSAAAGRRLPRPRPPVARGDYDAVRRYLVHREIDNDGVYRETVRPIHLDDGRIVPSLVYLADRRHRQFAGKLPIDTAAAGAPGAAPLAPTSTMSRIP